MKQFFFFALFFLTSSNNIYSQDHRNSYSKAIEDVLSLYDKKQIVALGENHGRFKESEFRLQLIKHPDFSKTVDVIVVEFANPLYQTIIDDYVNGKNVELNTLKKVWQNTTQVSGVWDSPVYMDFFKTVRGVNSKLSNNNKIRIIAADPPIDWSKVNSYIDFEPFSNRGSYPVEVVEREIYDKNLKALLIFGSQHTELSGKGFTSRLLKKHPGTIAIIMPPAFDEKEMQLLKRYIDSPNTQLIDLNLNNLGNIPYKEIQPHFRFNGLLKDAGQFKLFLGFEKDSVVHIPESINNDEVYQKEKKRRLKILSRN
ncbi:MAG: hypothetical protein R2785_10365 [Flavobacteriaceae bacterium]